MCLSQENLRKLKLDLEKSCDQAFVEAPERGKKKIATCLAELDGVQGTFVRLRDMAVRQIVNAMSAQIRTLADAMLVFSYDITEAELASYDARSPFMRDFMSGLQEELQEFQVS